MRHSNSVFHDLLKRVPWAVFDRLVAKHGADKHVRRLSTKSQFIALLFGQLSGAASLREIVGALASHAGRLYHLGAKPVSRSTLSDANALRPSSVFADLLSALVAQTGRGLRRAVGEATFLIDATSLPLCKRGSQWARFSHQLHGAKMHLVFDAKAERPVYAAVTPARINDITAAKEMPVQPGATYVFDLGYYDFGWWNKLDAAGCRIVTRFKSRTRLQTTADLPLAPDSCVLSDRIGLLPARMAKSRRNPFADPVREVCVKTQTGKTLRLLSNDLDAPADEIAALYKQRWQIELFFRWIKQTLRIRHFLGQSQNAVCIQIAIALIAYLLLRLTQKDQTVVQSPLAFARLVRANLMHRKRTDYLAKPPPSPKTSSNQLAFQW